jgi:hypothetical protein
MNYQEILNDKGVKPKIKTETLCKWILNNPEKIEELIDFSKKTKDPIKATCIESIEFATKCKPEIATHACLDFVSNTLTEKAPRIKWESAKVVGNIAHLFPDKLDEAITNLLDNSEHSGTVVRWSAAYAISQILKVNTSHNKELIPAVESIIKREEKNSIKKIYIEALKKNKS